MKTTIDKILNHFKILTPLSQKFKFAIILAFTFMAPFVYSQVLPDITNIKPLGLVSNAPVIEGNALVLYAEGGTECYWTGPNNFSSTDRFVKIGSCDSLNEGIYYLTIIDTTTDSIYNFQQYVEVGQSPSSLPCIWVDNDEVCQNGDLQINTAMFSNCTYTYTSTPALPGLTGQNPVISLAGIPVGTQIQICLTISCGGSNVCAGCVNVTVINCCIKDPMSVDLLENEFSSNLNNLSNTIVIKGTLTIDNIYTLPSNVTEIIMLNDAKMIIEPSMVLVIDGVNIHGCDELWHSIILNDKSHLEISNSTIADALYAVSSNLSDNTLSTYITLRSNYFINNYNSLTLGNCTPLLSLINNDFYGTTTGLIGTSSWAGQPPNVGIFAENCLAFGLTISSINEFYDICCGIWTWNSDLTIVSDAARFHDIITQTAYGASNYGGAAILSTVGGSSYSTLIKDGNSPNSPADFENCSWGIVLQKPDAYITNSRLLNVGVGIASYYNRHGVLDFENNTITCSQRGILMFQGQPLFSAFIHNNEIQVDGLGKANGQAAIQVFQNSQQPDNFGEISNNSITLIRGTFGIDLHSLSRYLVTENYISLNNANLNIAGIRLSGSTNNNVGCNYIYGPGPNYTGVINDHRPYGMQIIESTNSRYAWNQTANTYTGVRYEDGCYGTIFANHQFGSHNIGLFYNPQAVTGPQFHHANRWNGSYTTYSARNLGDWNLSRYTVGANCANCWPPPVIDPSFNWFLYDPNYTTPSFQSPCAMPDWTPPATDSSANVLDTMIVSGELCGSIFSDEIQWAAERYLYNRLTLDSTILSSSQLMQEFYDSVQELSSGRYQAIENDIQAANSLSLVSLRLIDSLNREILWRNDSITSINILLNSGISTADSLQYINLRQLFYAQIKDFKSQASAAIQGYYAIYYSNIEQLALQNEQLEENTVPELNQKKVNEISLYLSSNPDNKLSDTQKSDIFDIASQCPLAGGIAVYQARGFLALFMDTLFDDKTACLQAGYLKSLQLAGTEEPSFNYYPNPSGGMVTLSWENVEDDNFILEVTNLLGAVVKSEKIKAFSRTKTIDMKNLKSGAYFLKIKLTSERKNIGKIILTR